MNNPYAIRVHRRSQSTKLAVDISTMLAMEYSHIVALEGSIELRYERGLFPAGPAVDPLSSLGVLDEVSYLSWSPTEKAEARK
jgi:hypothetical protein